MSVERLTGIYDCDIHPAVRSMADLEPWLEHRWIEHFRTYGAIRNQHYMSGAAYHKSQPNASRRDAWPPEGGPQGSSLPFMRTQHLDQNGIGFGILNPLVSSQGVRNLEHSAALCRAINHWQAEKWVAGEPRLHASIVVPYEDAEASADEIRHWAGNSRFVQVLLLSRTSMPPGNKRYWPIYAAAADAGLPVGIHAFGNSGWPVTSSGWPSFYMDEMVGHAQTSQSGLVSLVIEGVFERWPKLKLVLIESGFTWAPSLLWRLDRNFDILRSEVPHLKLKPSEYVRRNVWWTSQPMDEPENKRMLGDIFAWLGWDRIMFSSDYPHWDFDDPTRVVMFPATDEQRRQFFIDNARGVYGSH
jgi:predicted TIM-barrel fold metal-dependent hydrolase